MNISEVPALFMQRKLPINVALIQVSPPDDFGWMSLGVSVDVTQAAAYSADLVIAQINSRMPRIMGQSLNLHPLVVLVAAMVGAHLYGVLGILLAAPLVATLRVLAEYTYYRLLDMPPFPELEGSKEQRGDQVEQAAQPVAATESKQVE